MMALSGTLPLFQVLVLRGLGTAPVTAVLARGAGAFRYRLTAADLRIIALRSAAGVGAAWLFVTAPFHMPLADATAILQSLPLALTLAGVRVPGGRVGWRRWLAVVAGFAGVRPIVRPGSGGSPAGRWPRWPRSPAWSCGIGRRDGCRRRSLRLRWRWRLPWR